MGSQREMPADLGRGIRRDQVLLHLPRRQVPQGERVVRQVRLGLRRRLRLHPARGPQGLFGLGQGEQVL